jgi:hypothetical protein
MEPGQISKSMGVDTKPAHKFKIGEYWVMVDPNMPEEMFNFYKNKIMDERDCTTKLNDTSSGILINKNN